MFEECGYTLLDTYYVNCLLLLTTVPHTPFLQIVFEEFGFNSLLAAPAPFFSLHHICNIPVTAQPAPQQPLSIPGVPAAAGSAGGQVIDSAEAALATYGAPVRALSAAGVAALTAAKAAGAGVIIDAGGHTTQASRLSCPCDSRVASAAVDVRCPGGAPQ